MMSEPFIVEGILNLMSQEGGFAYDAFMLDGQALDIAVMNHFALKHLTKRDFPPKAQFTPGALCPGDCPVGRVRITIERLDDASR